MGKKYMNYVGQVFTDVEYHRLGKPNDLLEIRLDNSLPFRLYCKMDEENWEEVSSEKRAELIAQLKEDKAKHSKNDYQYYAYDFYLANLGVRHTI